MLRTTVVFEGNLGGDAQLRFTPAGKAVCEVVVLVNTGRKDKDTGQWIDGEPTRHRVITFGPLAEHVADSIGKGDRVVVVGEERTESYTDRESGEKRWASRVYADAFGVSLRWHTARPERATREAVAS